MNTAAPILSCLAAFLLMCTQDMVSILFGSRAGEQWAEIVGRVVTQIEPFVSNGRDQADAKVAKYTGSIAHYLASAMTESSHPRSIRSFVVRGGRITEAQQRALEDSWPRYGVEFRPEPLDLDWVYGRQAPRVLEIGFGNGEHLFALATAHPERDYLGVEVHRPGVGRLFLSLEKSGARNVRAICHDAVEVLQNQIPPASLDEVLILFPDPWHKKRHHKRRLIQPDFVELVAERLKPHGVLHLATDWKPYAEHMMEVLSACSRFANVSPEGGYVPRDASRTPTRFERRGERLGHEVWDLAFRRV